MSIAVREIRMGDLLMLEEMLDAIAVDLTGRDAVDAMAPAASGGKAFLTDSASFAYAAYLDNAPVGGLWGARIRRPDGSVTVEVLQIAVVRAARRRGIGSLLVESAIGHARRLGATDLVLRGGDDVVRLAEAAAGAADESARLVRWTLS